MKKIILFVPFLLLLATSCKKDASGNSCAKTVAAISGTYSIVKVEIGSNGTFLDFTSQLDQCEKDDKLTLKPDGTSVYQDVGTVCTPPGDDTGTWGIDANGKMTISDNGNTDISTADITSFNCSTLVLTATDTASGDQFRLTMKK